LASDVSGSTIIIWIIYVSWSHKPLYIKGRHGRRMLDNHGLRCSEWVGVKLAWRLWVNVCDANVWEWKKDDGSRERRKEEAAAAERERRGDGDCELRETKRKVDCLRLPAFYKCIGSRQRHRRMALWNTPFFLISLHSDMAFLVWLQSFRRWLPFLQPVITPTAHNGCKLHRRPVAKYRHHYGGSTEGGIAQRPGGNLQFWREKPKLKSLKAAFSLLTTRGDSSGCIEVYVSCVKAAFSLLTTRGNSSSCIEVYASCVKAAFPLLTTRSNSSSCIEVYALCVKAAFSLLTTRGDSSGCIEVYASCVKAAILLSQ